MTKLTGLSCHILFYIVSVLVIVAGGAGVEAKEQMAGRNSDLLRLEKTNSCPECDLRGMNLNRMDLKDADLQGADLRNARMHLVNLAGADLRHANLEGAVLVGADLAGADLRGAILGERSLDGAYLAKALIDQPQAGASGEAIDAAETHGAAVDELGAGGVVAVRSEQDVSVVHTAAETPSPKKPQPMRTATMQEAEKTVDENDTQSM